MVIRILNDHNDSNTNSSNKTSNDNTNTSNTHYNNNDSPPGGRRSRCHLARGGFGLRAPLVRRGVPPRSYYYYYD